MADPKREQHTQAFREFAGGLTSQQRSEFTAMVQEFERDKTKPNPYQNEISGKFCSCIKGPRVNLLFLI